MSKAAAKVGTRNITVSVDEETHRLARIRAAELDTSVSALVREYLRSLASGREDTVTERVSQDELYDRIRARAARAAGRRETQRRA